MRKKIIISAVSILFFKQGFGQERYLDFRSPYNLIHKASNLYLSEAYAGAEYTYHSILEEIESDALQKEEYAFLEAIAAITAQTQGASLKFDQFKKDYPGSIYLGKANWALGTYYLEQGDFAKALEYLSAQDIYKLPERKRNDFQFKLGYAYLMQGKEKQALQYLSPLVHAEKYEEKALYYTGYIYYTQRDYAKAKSQFELLLAQYPQNASAVRPYLAQIQFAEKNYEQAIEEGEKVLRESNEEEVRSQINKVIGESYFALKKYEEALPYLLKQKTALTASDNYQLGYIYYKQGDYKKAVDYFNKITNASDEWAQAAYYQLGNAYVKNNQKKEALNAFQAAAQLKNNQKIQEEAAYQYAKLSYDIGNAFMPVPSVLREFINKYPQSPYTKEVQTLLVNSYITSGNYLDAIEQLEKIKNKSAQENQYTQQAFLYYGLQLLQNNKVEEALPYLKQAGKEDYAPHAKARALFWLGNIAYGKSNYSQAIGYFKQYEALNIKTEEYKEYPYELAYAYFKIKHFKEAQNYFKKYLASNPPGDYRADAQLRLADTYLGLQNKTEAQAIYREIKESTSNNADIAAYNEALLISNVREKAIALQDFIREYPVSTLNDDAQLALADTYIQQEEYVKANLVLENLINTVKNQILAEAWLRKGTVDYRMGKEKEAVDAYRKSAEAYPNSPTALQAINNAKRIFIKNADYQGFEKWANKFPYYTINKDELALAGFEEAKRHFSESEYKESIPKLEALLQNNPQKEYAPEVYYMLGESYYQTQKYALALPAFSESIKLGNAYREKSLLRLSQIYISQQENSKALLTLENLLQTTQNAAYKTYAEVALMRLYAENKVTDKALAMAEAVNANAKNEESIREEAKLIMAQNYREKGDAAKARNLYAELEKSSSSRVAVEALYYKAYFLYGEKDYKASNETLFTLASKYAEETDWGGRALILMAENYIALKDSYQANYILENVIKNYTEYPEITKKAKEVKKQLATK